jgi:iron complex transport system substrate-binding protein
VRIVSLLPGATESLFALGLGDRVVGVTHECDHPPEARALPRVTRSNLGLEGLDGGAIDERVRAAAAAGRELYAVDAGAVRRLRPDLVVAQDVCDVCAVPASQVERGLSGIAILRQHPHDLDDVLRGIEELGVAGGGDAGPLLAGLRARVAAVRRLAAGRRRVRAVFLEWLDPPYPAGHWTADLLRLAGIDDPLARPGRPSVAVSWGQVRDAGPEGLLLAPCGLTEPVGRREAERMAAEIAATGAREVTVFDGSAFFNRPGPRLVDSLEMLAEAAGRLCRP